MTTQLEGTLEIDNERGVIYFHLSDPKDNLITVLRICSLPKPIPEGFLDITHLVGCNWGKEDAQNKIQNR